MQPVYAKEALKTLCPTVRPVMLKKMKGKTPFEALRASRMGVNPAIGAMPVLLLDRLSRCTDEYMWDVSNIPWDYSPKKLKLVNETMAYYPCKPGSPVNSRAVPARTFPITRHPSGPPLTDRQPQPFRFLKQWSYRKTRKPCPNRE